MKARLFFFCALAMACATFAGCEKDPVTGSTRIEFPGLPGSYDKAYMNMTFFGESTIKGLYVTHFFLDAYPSNKSGSILNVSFLAFHDGATFPAGTYTFPSTGAGTASGFVAVGNSGIGGTLAGGSVTISNSGGRYTMAFNDTRLIKYDDDGDYTVNDISFTYTGTVALDDASENTSGTIAPDYGKSTIKNTISGETYPVLAFGSSYGGVQEGGYHVNSVNFYSDPLSTAEFYGGLNFYTDGSELTSGTYVGGPYDPERGAGYFYGDITENRIVDGEVVVDIAASGLYTVTFKDVRVEDEGGKIVAAYSGVWMGAMPE